MPQVVRCPECGTRMKVRTETNRRYKITCARCQGRIIVNGAEEIAEVVSRPPVVAESREPSPPPSLPTEEEETDRSRRRKKPTRSRKKGLWGIIIVGLLGLMLGGGSALAVVLLVDFGGGNDGLSDLGANLPGPDDIPGLSAESKGKVPARLLAYAPNDATWINYVTLKNQRAALSPTQLRTPSPFEWEKLEEEYGSLEGIDEILTTFGYSTPQRGSSIVVVSFNKPPDRATLIAGGQELKAKGKTYYKVEEGNEHHSFGDYRHFASDTLLIHSASEALLLEVINGDCGRFPAWFQGLIDEGDGYHTSVRRSRHEGGPVNDHGAIARLECKWVEKGMVHLHIVELFKDERAAEKAGTAYDRRSRDLESINVQVSGKRLIADHTLPMGLRNPYWR